MKSRVQPVTHVGEVLVRQYFEQHGRYFRQARFAVGAVPDMAARPLGFVVPADIIHYFVHNGRSQIAGKNARLPVGKFFVVEMRHADAQRADDRIVEGEAGVGMEGHRHIQRDMQPVFLRNDRRAARQIVYP